MNKYTDGILPIISKMKGIDVSGLDESAPLDRFEIDNIDMLDLILQIEETFSVEIDPELLVNYRTISDVAVKVEEIYIGRA